MTAKTLTLLTVGDIFAMSGGESIFDLVALCIQVGRSNWARREPLYSKVCSYDRKELCRRFIWIVQPLDPRIASKITVTGPPCCVINPVT